MPIFFYILFLFIGASNAQIAKTKKWIFGQGIGINFKGNKLDTFTVPRGYEYAFEGCGIYYSDDSELSFHSDNNSLYDHKHEYIQPKYVLNGSSSSSQASLITSINDTILHCFATNPILGTFGGYFYNAYDILNKKWVISNKKIKYPVSEAQALVNHQNGKWQWIVCHSRLGDTLYSYLITENGLETCPVISHAGPFYNDWYPGQGLIKFSEDGKCFVLTTWSAEIVVIGNFNNQTGQFTEKVSIPNLVPYGAEFMEKKLFVSSTRLGKIHEFDISKLDSTYIQKSKRIVYDTADDVALGQIQRAPNGKMYVAYFGSKHLGVLENNNGIWAHKYTGNIFGSKLSYAGFPNFNASYFHTPALNINYTYNCKTNTFHFIATDTFNANIWQWQYSKGSKIFSGSGEQTDFTFPDSGIWQVRCIGSNGSRKDTIIKTIEILKPLNPQYLGEDILLTKGASVNGTINGPKNMHCLHWQKLGDTLEIKDLNYKYADTGTFICKATNPVFCAFSDTIKVRICDSFANAAIIERTGDSLFTKSYATKYQWYINDTAIKKATKPALKLTQKGMYKLRTWNAAGCDSTSAVFDVNKLGIHTMNVPNIKINPNPNQGNFIIQSENQIIKSVMIYDILGNKVFEKKQLNSKFIQVDDLLNSGIYLVKINDAFCQKMLVN